MIYCLICGLLGSLLMLSGDMILYYTPQDFAYEANTPIEQKLEAITQVMKNISQKRLICGGMLGPIASFIYCIGYYHIILMCDEKYQFLAIIAYLCLCLGIIVGGTYHSHCAYLGLLGDNKYRDGLNIVKKYFQKFSFILYLNQGIGYLILIFLLAFKLTLFPFWMMFLSPGILFLLKPLVGRLPKGIRIIVSGGWSNWISVIYYLAMIIAFLIIS
jgi:hypothetical protein